MTEGSAERRETPEERRARFERDALPFLDQLYAALDVAPVASVQNELSLRFTESLTGGVVTACEQQGVAFDTCLGQHLPAPIPQMERARRGTDGQPQQPVVHAQAGEQVAELPL